MDDVSKRSSPRPSASSRRLPLLAGPPAEAVAQSSGTRHSAQRGRLFLQDGQPRVRAELSVLRALPPMPSSWRLRKAVWRPLVAWLLPSSERLELQ